MSQNLEEIFFKAGSIIVTEGNSELDGVYLIKSGMVEISKQIAGNAIVLATLGKNAIFGEMAVISQKPRSATVKALEDTHCYKLTAQDFEQKINQLDPFMRGVFRIISENLRSMDEKIVSPEMYRPLLGCLLKQ